MAGLGGNKKRSNSSTSRVSRFSEALGAAQESSQKSGYPETQPSEQQATQSSENLAIEDETAQYSSYTSVDPEFLPVILHSSDHSISTHSS